MEFVFILFLFIPVLLLLQGPAGEESPYKIYEQMIIHPESKILNLSYNYSGKWDFDGDGHNDGLFFIGNGGAHAYYLPRLILSGDKTGAEIFRISKLIGLISKKIIRCWLTI